MSIVSKNLFKKIAGLCFFIFFKSPLLWTQCHSESSRSEDVSSDVEEEDDSPSLSPSSSHSCSRAELGAPPSDSLAPGSLPLDGANFLSATPAQWSVEEVCRFISSLQGWCSDDGSTVSCSILVLILSSCPRGVQAVRSWRPTFCHRK